MPDQAHRPRADTYADPDDTKGSLEDEADGQALRLQLPHRGFAPGASPQEIAGTGTIDSLPGEHGDHGEHSGEELKKPIP